MLFLEEQSWEVRKTQEKGRGLFTKKALSPGRIIGDYTGIVIHPRDADLYEKGAHFYLMYYHDYAGIFPDLSKPDLYLLNHSCTPNCWMYTYKGHTLFFTLRKIFPGEELTISYLLSPKTPFCEPCRHFCRCESTFCTGSMHLSNERFNTWQETYNEIARQTKRKRIQRGKELRLLSSYPISIPDHPVYPLFGNAQKKAQTILRTTLPKHEVLRQMIRESGKVLSFPHLNLSVLGISADEIITKPH